MNHQTDIGRRDFIHTGISLAIAGSIFPISVIAAQQISEESLEEKLLSILNNRSSAIQIGLAILNAPDSKLQLSNLINSIMDNLKLSSTSLASMTKIELSERLRQQTVSDFDSGRMVNAGGWSLGRTEAQLCVLAVHVEANSFA